MDLPLVIAIAVTMAAACAAIFLAIMSKTHSEATQKAESELAEARAKITTLQSGATEETRRIAESDTRLSEIRRQFDQAATELNKLRQSEKDLLTIVQVQKKEIELQNAKLKDWEEAQKKFMAGANLALAESAAKLSNKLLEDHKRENTAATDESEKRVKKATEELFKQFETISNSVVSLNDRVMRNDEVVETVKKALSSPGGAGQFAEIGLENSLKSFGLKSGRDFLIQLSLEGEDGGRVRPDAVVFLPYDSVLVIDCKASKFLFELAAADNDEEAEAVGEKLRRTMRVHLRSLAGRDYRNAILADYRRAGKSSEIRRVLNVMYLPNEGAIEKVTNIDPGFTSEAAKHGITVVGPTGLLAIIAFARVEIDLGQQTENQEKIIEATRVLLERTATMIQHAASVGRGLKTASANYGKWLSSINRSLLPATRNLEKLGVRTDGNKFPNQLPGFQVIENEVDAMIDGEAEAIAAPEQLSLSDSSE
jgi:DNA recombination protein RmuC